jgi:hypothetical protein
MSDADRKRRRSISEGRTVQQNHDSRASRDPSCAIRGCIVRPSPYVYRTVEALTIRKLNVNA